MSRRDELLAAIQDRLVLVTSRNDPSPVLDRSALAQARDLAACLTDATDLAAERALGYFYYFRSTGLRRGRAEQELSAALRHFRMPFMTGTGTLPPALMASLAERAIPDARDLVRRTLSDTDPGLAQFAVDLTRRITRHLPDNHRAYPLVHGLLGTLLDTRFQRGGDLTDVNGAIAAGRIAARTGSRHSLFHGNLCGALVNRYQRTGDLSDVNEAVQSGRTAVKFADANDADRFGYLTNLGAALRMRFLRTHDLADADEAVDLSRSAARGIDADDPRRALFLSNLGVALQSRFGRTGALADIDEAVEVNRRAIQADPTYVGALSNLCLVLLNRYQRTGDLKDADEAVAAARAALHILPDDHPTRAVPWLSLSSALRFRFQGTGMLSDVNEAVAAGQAAVRATPDNHAERAARQANLAACLRMRFERTGDLADVDEAVRLGRSVLRDLPADHPTRAQHLAEFAAALQMRFEHVKDLADLDEAIEASRGAIRTAAADQHRTMPLTNLCIGLWMRFQHTRDPRDADAAAQAGRDALRLMPADHPNRAGILINLAQALQLRSAQDGSHTDTTEEQSAWEEAAASRTAPPRLRVRAARNAARLAAPSDPGRAAAFLEQAVLLLPQVAPRRLRRSDQQYFLATDTIDLAADAAALALADPAGTASERAARALRLAEAGRAVLLSQALDTRDDLSELRARHPRMATRFTELRGLLDQDQGQFAGAELPPGSDAGRERHLLVSELEELTTRIRGQADFASFGLPPTIEDLLAEAAHGPVVTFNISRYRSDALLLTGKGITSCPLPRLTHDRVSAQVDSFYQALDEAWAPDGDRIAAQRTLRGVLEWLWEAAAEPVLTALAATLEEAHGTPPGGMLPRVWWAPGGLLGLLPLHTAGFHSAPDDEPERRTVMDRVVSSYTPTIRALRHARRDRPPVTERSRSLIVAMPSTPGLSPLHHAGEEAERIRSFLPGPLPLTGTGSPPGGNAQPRNTPTTARVLAALPQCAITHFACHAASDGTDPSQSRLLLHDHATTPLTVAALAKIDLDRAQLAYLSACGTADPGNLLLLDEAIHLAGAFQLAGFSHVIGTLWPINDRPAADIAELFYTRLAAHTPGGTIAPSHSAEALHEAIRTMRDRYPSMPSLWAGFLHSGA